MCFLFNVSLWTDHLKLPQVSLNQTTFIFTCSIWFASCVDSVQCTVILVLIHVSLILSAYIAFSLAQPAGFSFFGGGGGGVSPSPPPPKKKEEKTAGSRNYIIAVVSRELASPRPMFHARG